MGIRLVAGFPPGWARVLETWGQDERADGVVARGLGRSGHRLYNGESINHWQGSNAMTTGRRTLSFGSFDEVMPDVERLLDGHYTVGDWSLAQICQHLSMAMRRVVDLPASTPSDPSLWLGEEEKRAVFASGKIPEGMPGPPAVMPTETRGEREEAEGLRQAIAHYGASAGPVIPHRFFGPLTKAEWDRLQLIHVAHHLSFAVPR
jgi:Protein of unknown function (DUF1569)